MPEREEHIRDGMAGILPYTRRYDGAGLYHIAYYIPASDRMKRYDSIRWLAYNAYLNAAAVRNVTAGEG